MDYWTKFIICNANRKVGSMEKIFTEENQVYYFDCTKALWATDELHELYSVVGGSLNDVDLVLETEEKIILLEYKNASIPNAANPDSFKPAEDKKINNLVKKFYDSLHYLTLLKKDKAKDFVYILEYPLGDSASRRMIRNRLKGRLPFQLQELVSDDVKLINKVEVLSIDEWNCHEEYGAFPICLIDT